MAMQASGAVAADVVGLAQEAVARAEAALEQRLSRSIWQQVVVRRQEIQVVDVDVAVACAPRLCFGLRMYIS